MPYSDEDNKVTVIWQSESESEDGNGSTTIAGNQQEEVLNEKEGEIQY